MLPNEVTSTGLPLASDSGFVISDIAIDTAALGFSSGTLPTQVIAFLSIRPVGILPLDSPQQTAALLVPPAPVAEPASLLLTCAGLLSTIGTLRWPR